MSYYIYGLRLKGGHECRYVGMTSKTPKARLASLKAESRGWYRATARPDALHQWLAENYAHVESFKIGMVGTQIEAMAMERTIIALAVRLGNRLLNTVHVPRQHRIPMKAAA